MTGVIINECDAERISQIIPFKKYFGLRKGYVIFPLNDELIDEHFSPPQEFIFKEFNYLSNQLDELLMKASIGISFTYIETEYFGGAGSQAAIVYSNGIVSFGPEKSSEGPINDALATLGLTETDNEVDAFDAVGLGGIRSSDELLNSVV